jgi:hypothetical protein
VTAIDFVNSYRTGVVVGVLQLVAAACVVELATYFARRRQSAPAIPRAVQP